jgi:hypothetical protein
MRTLSILLWLSMSIAGLQAAPVLTIPNNGAISGTPGQTVGWGFTMTSDSNYVTVIGSYLLTESNPALGLYEDYIGPMGGPVNAVLAPSYGKWEVFFNAGTKTGLGGFTISPNAQIGQSNTGTIRVLVELFTADPNGCDSDCYVDSISLDVPFSVTAVAPVPEPATVLLTGSALLALAFVRRRSQS